MSRKLKRGDLVEFTATADRHPYERVRARGTVYATKWLGNPSHIQIRPNVEWLSTLWSPYHYPPSRRPKLAYIPYEHVVYVGPRAPTEPPPRYGPYIPRAK